MARTITHQDDDETKPALFGDKDHLEISQSRTFTQMVFELLVEREPSESETKLLDLILNLSIDHGPHSPSGVETMKAAKDGKTMSEALASGVLQINERHGGAGGPLMEILYGIENGQWTIDNLVTDYLKEGKRLPGLGHRVYKDSDPRAQLIMKTALENGIGEEFVKIVNDLRDELEKQSGKSLPVNIDGAIAAVFCGFGLDPKLGIAVFLIARTPGLIGQYLNALES
ncbi:hypothetical protein HYW44_03105 [Candidatus Daviesbacteria bacterium]|nr:hypothetical protein [Candidatus Daviesbacteria bacterium]